MRLVAVLLLVLVAMVAVPKAQAPNLVPLSDEVKGLGPGRK